MQNSHPFHMKCLSTPLARHFDIVYREPYQADASCGFLESRLNIPLDEAGVITHIALYNQKSYCYLKGNFGRNQLPRILLA